MDNNRLINAFTELKASNRKALIPFLTSGYPNLETTGAMLAGIEARGGHICELGFPFSDPIADGPTIQASYTRALDSGITVDGIFDVVGKYRAGGGTMAMVAMVSYSIVFRRGVEEFCREASQAGFDGLIVPDLPIEESDRVSVFARENGLCNITLISPTTPKERQIQLVKASSGFVYFMSIAGITGERKQLPDSTLEAVRQLKEQAEVPVCIGFGISDAQMVVDACQAGDGAIVGSAIIHRINDSLDEGKSDEEIVEVVCDFCQELLEPLL